MHCILDYVDFCPESRATGRAVRVLLPLKPHKSICIPGQMNFMRSIKISSTGRSGIWIFWKNGRIINLVYKTRVYSARFTSGILLKLQTYLHTGSGKL